MQSVDLACERESCPILALYIELFNWHIYLFQKTVNASNQDNIMNFLTYSTNTNEQHTGIASYPSIIFTLLIQVKLVGFVCECHKHAVQKFQLRFHNCWC